MILPFRRFNFERQMLGPLASGLIDLLECSSSIVRILREPSLGPTIPDLIVGCWTRRAPPLSYPTTTWIDAHVRALVEREGAIHASEVRRRLHLSPNAAAAAESRLLKHRIIMRLSGGLETESVWSIAPGARVVNCEITAIEAKLTRWRDAVEQAANYLSFADRAYVVLDGNQVTVSEDLMTRVVDSKVGLIFQHGNALRHVLPAPTHSSPVTAERVIAMTKLSTVRGGRAFRTVH